MMRPISLCVSLPLLLSISLSEAGSSVLDIQVNGSTASYAVTVDGVTWFPSAAPMLFADASRASVKLLRTKVVKGFDSALGNFTEYQQYFEANGQIPITHVLRHFKELDTIQFVTRFPQGVNQTSAGDVNAVAAAFTAFQITGPAAGSPDERGYASWRGNMLADKYTKMGVWNEHADGIQGGIDGSLLAFFDAKAQSSLVLSASSNFMAANFHRPALSNTLYLGVMGGVTSIPANYEISFVLCASRNGPNAAFSKWGDFLLRSYGKDRSLRDSDFVLNYLGYSTDNGAYYYYHVENETSRWKAPESFEQTQIDIKAYGDSEGIPYRYILLDSWWYPKDSHGAVTTWTGLPSVYPHGLYDTWQKSGLRVQGHNRYWSATTPYAKQNGGAYDFIIEPKKQKSIPVDQSFWDDLFANSTRWGLTTYEQDWLHNEFEGLDSTLESATLARQWLLQMGRGASKNGLTIQYCMAYPRFILQSVEVPAVTNYRASDDYMSKDRVQWKLGLNSIIADSLALAPSKDNYWSKEKQPGNNWGKTEPNSELQSAISSYTAGPVAPSDMIGGSDSGLILRACNSDGLLLRPSRPAKSIDATFAFRAFGRDGPDGEVLLSYSDISALRFHHILAAELKTGYNIQSSAVLGSAQRGSTRVFKHSPGNTTAPAVLLQAPFDKSNPLQLQSCGLHDFQLLHTTPVFQHSEWIILGELSKWVPMSSQRVESISMTTDGFSMALRGAAGENVEMWFGQKLGADVVKVACTLSQAGTATLTMPGRKCDGAAPVGALFV